MADERFRIDVETLLKYDIPGPRYTSYPTAPIFHKGVGQQDYINHLKKSARESEKPISVYFHIPFCKIMCHFCGCNAMVIKRKDIIDRYLDDLDKEMDLVSDILGRRRIISQMHWGGGSPNSIGDDRIKRLFSSIKSHFSFSEDAEIALEIDPRSSSPDQIFFLRELGFNRISMGVQDFDPKVQRLINRIQPESVTIPIFEACRRSGFKSINIDLVYGLPGQSWDTFRYTVEKVIELSPDRIALFSFAYVPWMKPHQKKILKEWLPKPVEKFNTFAQTVNMLMDAGYEQIGMDHFAKPDDELCISLKNGNLYRNFQGYTVKRADDLIGFGVTSIGEVKDGYFQNLRRLGDYHLAISKGSFATEKGYIKTQNDNLRGYIIREIMCNLRVNYEKVSALFGIESFSDQFHLELERLLDLQNENLVDLREDGLYVTPKGRFFLRNIAMIFDEYLPELNKSGRAKFSRTI